MQKKRRVAVNFRSKNKKKYNQEVFKKNRLASCHTISRDDWLAFNDEWCNCHEDPTRSKELLYSMVSNQIDYWAKMFGSMDEEKDVVYLTLVGMLPAMDFGWRMNPFDLLRCYIDDQLDLRQTFAYLAVEVLSDSKISLRRDCKPAGGITLFSKAFVYRVFHDIEKWNTSLRTMNREQTVYTNIEYRPGKNIHPDVYLDLDKFTNNYYLKYLQALHRLGLKTKKEFNSLTHSEDTYGIWISEINNYANKERTDELTEDN